METKTVKMLPKTAGMIANGGLYAQSIKCGKSNCKCSRGELHTGYYYFFTRVNGKLVKTYVRKSEVEHFTDLIFQSIRNKKQLRQVSKEATQLLKKLRSALSERQSFINSLKGD